MFLVFSPPLQQQRQPSSPLFNVNSHPPTRPVRPLSLGLEVVALYRPSAISQNQPTTRAKYCRAPAPPPPTAPFPNGNYIVPALRPKASTTPAPEKSHGVTSCKPGPKRTRALRCTITLGSRKKALDSSTFFSWCSRLVVRFLHCWFLAWLQRLGWLSFEAAIPQIQQKGAAVS